MKSRVGYRSLVTNAFGNALAFVATLAVSFVLAPIILRALGDTRYGAWSFVESFLAYLTLFDLGVAAAVVRFVPKFVATDDRTSLNRLFSTSIGFFACAGLGALLIGLAFYALLLDWFLQIPVEYSYEFQLVYWLLVGNFALTLPMSVFPAMLDGLGMFVAKSSRRTAVLLFVRVPLTLAVLPTEQRLANLAWVITVCTLLEHLAVALMVFRRLPELRFRFRLIDRDTFRMIRGYSVDAFLAMIAGRLSFHTDAFVIAARMSPSAITYFSFPARLVEMGKAVLRSATTTLTPAVSSLEAREGQPAVRELFIHATRAALYLALPVQVGLYLFGNAFLQLWLGTAYAELCSPLLFVLAATFSLTLAQSAASRVLYGLGRLRFFARVTLIEGIANLTLSLVLVGPLGLTGVAWGTVIPHALFCVTVIAHTCHLMNVTLRRFLTGATLRPLMMAAILVAVWFFARQRFFIDTWSTWFAIVASGTMLYVTMIWLVEGRFRVVPFVRVPGHLVRWLNSLSR